jgi:hypothetical protein
MHVGRLVKKEDIYVLVLALLLAGFFTVLASASSDGFFTASFLGCGLIIAVSTNGFDLQIPMCYVCIYL